MKKSAATPARTATSPKTIGLSVGSETRLRFKRKVGGPAQVQRVKDISDRAEAPAGAPGHIHAKVGGRHSHGSHN